MLARQLQVDVHRGVVRALQQEEARGVDADVVEHVVERDELALALGHLRLLTALDQVDQLHDHELEPVALAAERLPGGQHARDVAVVVGAPRVDEAVEFAAALVEVVGDVRREVGDLAVRAAQDAVLVVAEGRRAQPDRPLALVDMAVL